MLAAVLIISSLLTSTTSYQRPISVSPSDLVQELAQRKKNQPTITPKELAVFANQLLEKRGFDYSFDVCDILPKADARNGNRTDTTASYALSLTNGKQHSFKFNVAGADGGMCGECMSLVPSAQVTKTQMVLVADGKRYRVQRPASFILDEVELVDGEMKTVQRTWQLPYQTIPVGISRDGTKLYLNFYTQYEVDGLLLELTEKGGLVFRDRSEVRMIEGKVIEDHPKDPNNAYLTFIRFSAGDKAYIIRFSAPCT